MNCLSWLCRKKKYYKFLFDEDIDILGYHNKFIICDSDESLFLYDLLKKKRYIIYSGHQHKCVNEYDWIEYDSKLYKCKFLHDGHNIIIEFPNYILTFNTLYKKFIECKQFVNPKRIKCIYIPYDITQNYEVYAMKKIIFYKQRKSPYKIYYFG